MPSINEQEHLYGRFSRRRKPADEVLRLDIELEGTAVRRRISIPANFTLDDLHLAVQVAMGWQNEHLHCFIVNGREYVDRVQRLYRKRRDGPEDQAGAGGAKGAEGGSGLFLEENQRLGTVFASSSTIEYRYDFSDDWNHLITAVGRISPEESDLGYVDARVPRLMDGEGACPPEDIGGASGYRAFLVAVAQAARGEEPSEVDEAMRDLARSYDPEHVDIEYANELFQGGFLSGETEAAKRREAGLKRLAAEEDRRRHEEESWFLKPRIALPKEVTRAGKRVARIGLIPIPSATTAGFLAGLHAAPEVIPPSVWVPVLLDYPEGLQEREFRNQEEAQGFFGVLMEAYNAMGAAMRSGELPLPFSYVSSMPDEVENAERWTDGFLTAFWLCSGTSAVTGHDEGARSVFTLDLLREGRAERFAKERQSTSNFTPAEIRRYALDRLVEDVSYIYARAMEAVAAPGGTTAGESPDSGGNHAKGHSTERGQEERLSPQQRRNRRKRRRKK